LSEARGVVVVVDRHVKSLAQPTAGHHGQTAHKTTITIRHYRVLQHEPVSF